MQTACQRQCACSESEPERARMHAERKRKHAPISYKPPERHTSGAERDKAGTDTAKREAALDKKGSGADDLPKQGSGLEGRLSGLDRSVSRTESGHKSVFERLHRYASCTALWESSCHRMPVPWPLDSVLICSSSTEATCDRECLYPHSPLSFCDYCCIHQLGKPVCAAKLTSCDFVVVNV